MTFKLCFLFFACKLTVSKNFFQILNDLFFTREYKKKSLMYFYFGNERTLDYLSFNETN